MSSQFITADIWATLTEAAWKNKKPAYVAVAYFGKAAPELLRLSPGSQLVVDASENAVKHGQTYPFALQRMHRRKVAVYSVQNLHAKVFVFEKAAFIGSANASKSSANFLQEAMVRTTDSKVVREAREFVRNLCLEPLGPKELKRLQKLYRPPRFFPGQANRKGSKQHFSPIRIASTRATNISEGLERAFEAGRRQATRKRKRGNEFYIDEFWWPIPCPFRDGHMLIEVYKNARGRTVSPPGRVIHTHKYRTAKEQKTLVYVEFPDWDWVPFSKCSKDIKRILKRGGPKSQMATRSLLSFWKARAKSD